jgi:hypothetical protein
MSISRPWLKVVLWSCAAVAVWGAIGFYWVHRGQNKFRAEVLVKGTLRQQEELGRAVAEAEAALQATANWFADKDEYEKLVAAAAEARESILSISNHVEEIQQLMKARRYDEVRVKLSPSFGLRKGETRDTFRKLLVEKKGEAESVTGACRTLAGLRNTAWRNSQAIRLRLSPLETLTPSWLKAATNSGLPDYLVEVFKSLGPGQFDHIRSNSPPELRNLLGASLFLHEELLQHIQSHTAPEETNQPAHLFLDGAREAYRKVQPAAVAVSADYNPALHDGKFTTLAYEKLVEEQNAVVDQIRNGDQLLVRLLRFFDYFEDQYYSVVVGQYREPNHEEFKCFCVVKTCTPTGATTKDLPLGIHLARWNFYSVELQTNYVREYKARHELRLKKGWLDTLQPQFVVEKPEDLPALARVKRPTREDEDFSPWTPPSMAKRGKPKRSR